MYVVRFAKSDENRKRSKEIVFGQKKMLHYSLLVSLQTHIHINTPKCLKCTTVNYLFWSYLHFKTNFVVRFAENDDNRKRSKKIVFGWKKYYITPFSVSLQTYIAQNGSNARRSITFSDIISIIKQILVVRFEKSDENRKRSKDIVFG